MSTAESMLLAVIAEFMKNMATPANIVKTPIYSSMDPTTSGTILIRNDLRLRGIEPCLKAFPITLISFLVSNS